MYILKSKKFRTRVSNILYSGAFLAYDALYIGDTYKKLFLIIRQTHKNRGFPYFEDCTQGYPKTCTIMCFSQLWVIGKYSILPL
jgi:hypothetical protein